MKYSHHCDSHDTERCPKYISPLDETNQLKIQEACQSCEQRDFDLKLSRHSAFYSGAWGALFGLATSVIFWLFNK